MRNLMFSALIGVALLCPITAMASEPEETRQIEIAGYDITFPGDWVESTEGVTLGDNDMESYGVQKEHNSISGSMNILAYKMDSDEFGEETVLQNGETAETKFLGQMFSPLEIESVEPYDVADTTGLMLKFNGKIEGEVFVGHELVFASESENRYIRFLFVESPEKSVPMETEYWDVLDSIEVHPVVEPPFDDLHILFYDHMENDVTGEWRVALTSTPHPVSDYIEYYYKTYVKPDDMVHVIVNFTLKTTTLLRSINTGFPYFEIATYEYADGDEHDAKQCPGGISYGSQIAFTDTWEVQDWDEYWASQSSDESEEW